MVRALPSLLLGLLLGGLLAACGAQEMPPDPPLPEVPAAESPAVPEEDLSDAEREALRTFRRSQLLEEAARTVGGKEFTARDLEAPIKALRDDVSFAKSREPADSPEQMLLDQLRASIAQRRLFLGVDEAGESPEDAPTGDGADAGEGVDAEPRGALYEAYRLLLWLQGDPAEPCDVIIRTKRRDGTVEESLRPWPVPAPEPAPQPAPPAAPPPASTEAPAPSEPGSDPATPTASQPEPKGGDQAAPAAPADPLAPVPSEEKPAEPAPPADPDARPRDDTLEAWVEWVKRKEGGLLGKDIAPGECSTVQTLLRLANTKPDYLARAVVRRTGSLERFPLSSVTPFAYNRPYLALRRALGMDRLVAWSKEDATSTIVDESTVREKAKRAKDFEDRLAARKAEREAVVKTLDSIVDQVGLWQDAVSILSGDIQEEHLRLEAEAKAAAPPPAPAEEPKPGEAEKPAAAATPAPLPRSLKLRVLEAQEATVSMELNLILHTALRAKERLAILDALIKVQEDEAARASDIHRRFAAELAKVRSGRALRRLLTSRQKLESRLARLSDPPPEAGTREANSVAAYQGILALNEVVQEVVNRRRILNEIAAAQTGTRASTPAAVDRVRTEPEAKKAEEAKPEAANDGPALRDGTRRVDEAAWGLDTIQLAQADLLDPRLRDAFDAELVARHYAVASRQALMLRAGLTHIRDTGELERQYEALVPQVSKTIESAEYYVRRSLTPELESLQRDYQFALEDLRNERRRFEDLLAATESYRKVLLDQGPRSLAIRVESDLHAEEIARAIEESATGVRTAVQWLGGDTDEDVFDWCAGRWLKLLTLLGLGAALAFVVFASRRWIDRRIEARAARTPGLRWVGASVRGERQAAEERRKQEEMARKSAEEALRAPPPPPAPRSEAVLPPDSEAEAEGEDIADADARGGGS